jgi:hypothetical protein
MDSEKKLMDIETFKQSVIMYHTLRKLDHVREWIENEGKRLVDEYALKRFKNLMNTYPSLTINDFVWLKEGYETKIYRELVLFEKYGTDTGTDTDTEIAVCRKENDEEQKLPYVKSIHTINYIELLPMSMTHLYGGGYYSLVEDSLLN